jgi:hypothetical protein
MPLSMQSWRKNITQGERYTQEKNNHSTTTHKQMNITNRRVKTNANSNRQENKDEHSTPERKQNMNITT